MKKNYFKLISSKNVQKSEVSSAFVICSQRLYLGRIS
jgi:hypothetical protein